MEDRGTCGAGIVCKGGARVAKEVWCIGGEGIGQMVEYAEALETGYLSKEQDVPCHAMHLPRLFTSPRL